MKVMARYGFILGITCILAAGFLALVNFLTQPKIYAQNKLQEEKILGELLPQAARFEEIKSSAGEILYYKAYNSGGQFSGIIFKAAGKGYSGTIEVMSAMDEQGRIIAIKVLNHNETPGLGSRVSEAPFMSRFSNKNISDLDNIQAITGATISSLAVIDSVKNKAEEVKALLK